MDILDNADHLLRQGKYSEAITLLEEVHQANPDEESILLRLAWAHHDSGAIATAIEYLEILLDRELQRKIFTGFAFDELVRIYRQGKNFSRLVDICKNAVARQPDDVCLLSELGNAYLLAGRVREACSTFEKLVQLENDNTAFYCLWGEALFIDGNTSASEAAYMRAGEIDSDQADRYYYKIADLFIKGGYFEDAKRLLEACITANPVNPLYHCCLGDVLVYLDRLGEAQSEYNTAAHYDDIGAGAYYNRFGNVLARTNHHQEAIKAFEKALKIEPNNPVYIRHLALSYKAMGLIKDVSEKK